MLVTNNGDFTRVFGDVVVVPGVNNLTKEQVDFIKKKSTNNPALSVVIKQLDFEKLQDGISEMTVEGIKSLVAETGVLDILEDLREEEVAGKNRNGAITAIDERIAELKGETTDVEE